MKTTKVSICDWHVECVSIHYRPEDLMTLYGLTMGWGIGIAVVFRPNYVLVPTETLGEWLEMCDDYKIMWDVITHGIEEGAFFVNTLEAQKEKTKREMEEAK